MPPVDVLVGHELDRRFSWMCFASDSAGRGRLGLLQYALVFWEYVNPVA